MGPAGPEGAQPSPEQINPNPLEQAARVGMAKLEEKNSQLGGRLVAIIGVGEDSGEKNRALVFPTPLETHGPTSVVAADFLALTPEGFKVARVQKGADRNSTEIEVQNQITRTGETLSDLQSKYRENPDHYSSYDTTWGRTRNGINGIWIGNAPFIEGQEPNGRTLISNPDGESIQKIMQLNMERATEEHRKDLQREEAERRNKEELEKSTAAQVEILNNLDQILS